MDEIRMHDVVEMRKKHPCGSAIWTVTRIGADIKIKCSGCGRVVMLDRVEFLRRRKKLITPGPVAPEVSLGIQAEQLQTRGDTANPRDEGEHQ
ncbi:MAG: DUF951 domain-containing protein [Clostridiales bacterium]|jgi:hypothetical protein|nr:DUF951 domain-containing protein [Clostridiales bacterium]